MDETLRGSGEGWGHWHFAPGGARPFKLNYTSRGGAHPPPSLAGLGDFSVRIKYKKMQRNSPS